MTILDKDADGVIRILIESEDHLMRAIYLVMLEKTIQQATVLPMHLWIMITGT